MASLKTSFYGLIHDDLPHTHEGFLHMQILLIIFLVFLGEDVTSVAAVLVILHIFLFLSFSIHIFLDC